MGTGGGDPIPRWLKQSHCISNDFCQCNLIGKNKQFGVQGCYHPGDLYGNINMQDVCQLGVVAGCLGWQV